MLLGSLTLLIARESGNCVADGELGDGKRTPTHMVGW